MVIRPTLQMNTDLELARLFGFACVVIAHGNALGIFDSHPASGFVIDELCRSAVPLFFLISGYLWKPSQMGQPLRTVIKMFPRVAIPFVLWVMIYVFFDRVHWLYPTPDVRNFRSYITTPWTGGIAFHLWFLPALLVGVAVSLGLIKYFGVRTALWISLGLFFVGSLLGSYLHPFGIEFALSLYRNGIFFGPVFLITGHYLQTMKSLPGPRIFLSAAIFGAILNLIEGYFIADTFPHGHDLSLGVIPFGVGVFGLFLHLNSKGITVASWGRDVFGAYLAHVFIMKILIAHLVLPGLGAVVAILLLTFVTSLVFSRLAKRTKLTLYLAP